MRGTRPFHCVVLAGCLASAAASAGTLNTIYSFPGGGDGLMPFGGVVDKSGVLYTTTEYGGAFGRGAVVAVNAKTGAETLVYSFKSGGDGYYPQAAPILVGKLLYGTTAYGGATNAGSIYSVDPASGAETVVYSFSQASGTATNTPLFYAKGYLYGETFGGGTSNEGTVFKLNVKTGVETTLHSFAGGTDGCLGGTGAMVQVGSLLYGTTISCGASGGGVLFSVDPNTGAETVVHAFGSGTDGFGASNGVVAAGTVLYGTTQGGGSNYAGTIYSYDTVSGAEAVVYNFTYGADGGGPQASAAYASGVLYATTSGGGGAGYGTVVAVSASTGAETTLYSFAGGKDGGIAYAPVTVAGGMLYGTTAGPEQIGGVAGTVFSLNIQSHAEKVLHDFVGPHPFFQANSPVTALGGLLYGTTENGGTGYFGTIYQLDPSTGAQNTLYSFSGGADGAGPTGGLTAVGKTLYGAATQPPGNSANGTIFAFDTVNNQQSTLHTFNGNDGSQPNGALLSYNNLLYGTTRRGGADGVGTIFSLDPATGKLTTLYSFTGNDGWSPTAGLIVHAGVLYGTTTFGGNDFAGNVFAFNLQTQKESVLYNFTGGADGYLPFSGVTYVGGVLYGTTQYGGTCGGQGCGVVFGVKVAGGAETIVHDFTGGADGLFPGTPLTYDGTTLYGGAFQGGAGVVGTVFSVVPKTGVFNTLYSFTGGSDGFGPGSALLDMSGTLVGTTDDGGTLGAGTVFSLTP